MTVRQLIMQLERACQDYSDVLIEAPDADRHIDDVREDPPGVVILTIGERQ